MLKIVNAPLSVLSEKAKEVKKIDSSTLKFLEDFKKALLSATDPVGVGLAAPQVGVSLRIFITKPTEKSNIQVFINPKVTSDKQPLTTNQSVVSSQKLEVRSDQSEVRSRRSKLTKLEGCLSLENIWGKVKRNPTVRISYLDETGKKHTKEFKGFMATIIQHEMDHLNGILFPKRVLEQKGTLYKSTKNEKGEDIFEEIEI